MRFLKNERIEADTRRSGGIDRSRLEPGMRSQGYGNLESKGGKVSLLRASPGSRASRTGRLCDWPSGSLISGAKSVQFLHKRVQRARESPKKKGPKAFRGPGMRFLKSEQIEAATRRSAGVDRSRLEPARPGRALIQRAKCRGARPVNYVLAERLSGRHLLCVVIHLPDGRGFPVTARPMTAKEKRRYKQWKNL